MGSAEHFGHCLLKAIKTLEFVQILKSFNLSLQKESPELWPLDHKKTHYLWHCWIIIINFHYKELFPHLSLRNPTLLDIHIKMSVVLHVCRNKSRCLYISRLCLDYLYNKSGVPTVIEWLERCGVHNV